MGCGTVKLTKLDVCCQQGGGGGISLIRLQEVWARDHILYIISSCTPVSCAMQLFVDGIRKHLNKENEEFKAKGLNGIESSFILSNSKDKPSQKSFLV